MPFYAIFYHYYSLIFEIALRIHKLLSPYIAHKWTAQNLILSVRLSLFALFLIERHCSQNQGSLKDWAISKSDVPSSANWMHFWYRNSIIWRDFYFIFLLDICWKLKFTTTTFEQQLYDKNKKVLKFSIDYDRFLDEDTKWKTRELRPPLPTSREDTWVLRIAD